MKSFIKDTDAILDFQFNWAEWLTDNETIEEYEIIIMPEDEDAIEVDDDEELNGVVTVWLSGGILGRKYSVTCRITTDQGRTDDRTMNIRCVER
jgi:hypothetical protein